MSFNPGGGGGIAQASDVALSNPLNNDALTYDSAVQKWENTTLTKTHVGLPNVDNTSDVNKPISTATQTALDGKAATTHTHAIADVTNLQTTLDTKPTISSGAGVPASTPTKVGDIYIDTTGDDAYIAVGTASSADWEKSNDGAGGGGGTWGSITGTLSNQTDLQTALNGKAATSHTHTASQISDSTTVGRNVLTAADQAAARTAIGVSTANFVSRPVLAGDGTTDDAPAIQAAIDAGTYVISLDPGKTYLLDSAIFIDGTSAFTRVVIQGNGAILKLGANLPTTNWSRDTTTRFAIFPNTLRSALSAGVVTVNDANRATGSGGALRSLIVRDLTVDAQAANRGFSFGNRTAVTMDNVTFYRGRVLSTWWDYSDANTFKSCYSRGGSGPAGQVLVEQYQQGDGLIVENGKADSSVGLLHLTTCRGALISGTVTGKITLTNCSGIVISGAHQEGQQSTMTSLVISNSHVTLQGTIIYENWSSTVCPITINDSADEPDTELVLTSCQVTQLHTTSTGTTEFSPFIEIITSGDNTKIVARDLRGMFASSAMSGKHPEGVQPAIKAPVAIQTAFDSPAGRHALATGNWTLKRTASGVWTVRDTVHGGAVVSVRESAAPSIVQLTTSSGVNAGGTLTNGQSYQYAVAVIDALGNYSAVSSASAATANANGAVRLLLGLSSSPSVLIVWRDAGASVLSAPDAYCIIPVRAARPYLYDTGNYLMGRPWITTSVPVPNTVASTNTTQDAIAFGGGVLYVEAGALKYKGSSSTITTLGNA